MSCLRLVQHHAGFCCCRLAQHSVPLSLPGQSPLISCYFNSVLSGRGTDALRRPTSRGRANYKAEAQELCEQRRQREISPCSHRSSGLNVHNQIDVPCICGIPGQTTNHPKTTEVVDFGSNCRLGVCFLYLICFWVYVYLSLVLRAYYHWQICLLIWLLSSFF